MGTSVLKIAVVAGSSPLNYALTVTDLISGVVQTYPDAGGWVALGGSTNRLRALLEDVQTHQQRAPSLGRLASDVNDLIERGRQVFYEFIGAPPVRRATEIETLAKAAVEGLREQDPDARPQIELEAPVGYFVPLEIFPLFDVEPTPARPEIGDILRVVRALAGFGASIRRVVSWRTVPTNQTLEFNDEVPISMFWHKGLTGANTEYNWFLKTNRMAVDGPWPGQRRAPDEEREIAGRIVAPPVFETADGGRHRTAAVHFACHCDAPANPAQWHTLRLRRGLRNVSISMPLLSEVATALQRARPDDFDDGPLGFVNACRAANVTYDEPWSVARQCLDVLRYRAVIAPVVAIMDNIAAELSAGFYAALLDGATVGTALVIAREGLLTSGTFSLIGLAYTCYGESDLTLRQIP